MLEQTLFFVKPKSLMYADEIFDYLSLRLGNENANISLIQSRCLASMPFEGWMEFYNHMLEKFPEQLKKMAEYFASENVDLAVLEGEGIQKKVKELAGPTRYKENPDWTIRGKWGPYKLPHTIVHSSDIGEVEREMNLIKIYGFEENGTKI